MKTSAFLIFLLAVFLFCSSKKSPGASNNAPGISVMDDTLHIILFGVMELTPNEWVQSGGIRCAFKRIQ